MSRSSKSQIVILVRSSPKQLSMTGA